MQLELKEGEVKMFTRKFPIGEMMKYHDPSAEYKLKMVTKILEEAGYIIKMEILPVPDGTESIQLIAAITKKAK